MKTSKIGAAIVLSALFAIPSWATPPEDDAVLAAMEQELRRTLELLAGEDESPYFLSYEITESRHRSVTASFGAVTARHELHSRLLDIDLRLGDYELDNTHPVRGEFGGFGGNYSYIPMPLDAGADAIRTLLWYHTDERYKRARERLLRLKTHVRVKVEEEDRSADFSPEEPRHYLEESAELVLDTELWEARLRRFTAPFAEHGEIFEAQAAVQAEVETRWYTSSEGSRIRVSQPRYRLILSAFTKADDGMELPRYETFYATDQEGLPAPEKAMAAAERMIADLLALRAAPVVEPYTGPAVLSGRASGVFFHEIFGHRVEGHRQKSETEGQTFKEMVGEKILPETFSVYFDPTLETYAGHELAGFYRFDNQGVAPRRVSVVERGTFKSFLMSRSPIEGFGRSNGHGRKEPGYAPVARQSNLLVEVEDALAPDELDRRLIELIRAQGKPYGLRFEDVQGGFTLTGRSLPNAFNILPILVYRVYADGREELVRGVDLIGTPLTAFSRIVAADTAVDVFNGTCGAESGGVPVATASPRVLVSQIEVQKKEKSPERLPILPAPGKEAPP